MARPAWIATPHKSPPIDRVTSCHHPLRTTIAARSSARPGSAGPVQPRPPAGRRSPGGGIVPFRSACRQVAPGPLGLSCSVDRGNIGSGDHQRGRGSLPATGDRCNRNRRSSRSLFIAGLASLPGHFTAIPGFRQTPRSRGIVRRAAARRRKPGQVVFSIIPDIPGILFLTSFYHRVNVFPTFCQ